MTTFQIDIGLHPDDPLNLVPDWFKDQIMPVCDPRDVVHSYAYHLIGAMRDPKKMDTVRRHILSQWRFLRVLADVHPGVFDELLCAYAERALAFE